MSTDSKSKFGPVRLAAVINALLGIQRSIARQACLVQPKSAHGGSNDPDERAAFTHKALLKGSSQVLPTIASLSKLLQVPLALIEGRVPFILWPPSRAGRVKSHMPPGRLLVKNDEALNDPSRFGAL